MVFIKIPMLTYIQIGAYCVLSVALIPQLMYPDVIISMLFK
jgi:hypothetical protein